MRNNLWVASTHFQKPSDKLCSFKPPGTVRGESDWSHGSFFQIDYALMPQRWKNGCRNTECDNAPMMEKCANGSLRHSLM